MLDGRPLVLQPSRVVKFNLYKELGRKLWEFKTQIINLIFLYLVCKGWTQDEVWCKMLLEI